MSSAFLRTPDSTVLTDRDLDIAAWIAKFHWVGRPSVSDRFSMGRSQTYDRLAALVDRGLLDYERLLMAGGGAYFITRRGCTACNLDLPRGGIDIRTFGHERLLVNQAICLERAGWSIATEREIRSAAARHSANEWMVTTPTGHRHVPDIIATHQNHRVAWEIELTTKRDERIRDILQGYRRARHLSGACYLVPTQRMQLNLAEKVRQVGAAERIFISTINVEI